MPRADPHFSWWGPRTALGGRDPPSSNLTHRTGPWRSSWPRHQPGPGCHCRERLVRAGPTLRPSLGTARVGVGGRAGGWGLTWQLLGSSSQTGSWYPGWWPAVEGRYLRGLGPGPGAWPTPEWTDSGADTGLGLGSPPPPPRSRGCSPEAWPGSQHPSTPCPGSQAGHTLPHLTQTLGPPQAPQDGPAEGSHSQRLSGVGLCRGVEGGSASSRGSGHV